MKLPLHLDAPGHGAFYLCDAHGRYVARSLGDSEDARADLLQLMHAMNECGAIPLDTRNATVQS